MYLHFEFSGYITETKLIADINAQYMHILIKPRTFDSKQDELEPVNTWSLCGARVYARTARFSTNTPPEVVDYQRPLGITLHAT
jgi:hypothetical protein